MRGRAEGGGPRGEIIAIRSPFVTFTDLLLVRLTFYDPPGTGGGVSAKAFDYSAPGLIFALYHIMNDYFLVSDLLHEAFEVVETCRCKDGCVHCEYCDERGDLNLDAMYKVFKVLPAKRVMKCAPSWGLDWYVFSP